MRHGQPEHQQVLLRLWQLAIVWNMFVLQPSQPPLREVLRLVRTQARGERVESTETPHSAPSRRFSMALVWPRHWRRALQRMPSVTDRAFGLLFTHRQTRCSTMFMTTGSQVGIVPSRRSKTSRSELGVVLPSSMRRWSLGRGSDPRPSACLGFSLQGGCFPAQRAETTRLSHRGFYTPSDSALK
jgi:hypothetical protein